MWNDQIISIDTHTRLKPAISQKKNEITFTFSTENTQRLPVLDIWVNNSDIDHTLDISFSSPCFV